MTRSILATLALFVATGCATQPAEPAPAPDHPANPTAAEAPAPRPSTTLQTAAAGTGGNEVQPAPPAGGAADEAPEEPTGAGAAAAPAGADAFDSPVAYTCPHHPRIMQAEPGDCPRCGMTLEATTSRQTSPLRQRNDNPEATDPAGAHEGHGGHGEHRHEMQETEDTKETEDTGAADGHGGHG